MKYPCAVGYCFLISLVFVNAEIAIRAPIAGTFRLHLFPTTLENPRNCTLTNPQNAVIHIPLNYEASDNSERVEPLGNGQCGARIHNTLARNDAGRWILTLTNGEETVRQNFRITTIAWEVPVNRTTSVTIGTIGTIMLCGPSNNMLYCELRDPLGNLVELTHRLRCQTTIQRVMASHIGVWTCTVGVLGGHEEIHATHTLVGIEEPVSIFANYTSLGSSITWNVEGLSAASLWCRAFAPNGETIAVSPGMDNDKYLSVGTDLTSHTCGLLIKGTFPKKFYGIWRLEMAVNNRRAMGGFIRMPEGVVPGPEDRNTTKNRSGSEGITELNVMARNNFRISCQTEYSAGYCWIGGPNGQVFTPSENLTVGRCSQMVNTSTSEQHSGLWTCNMAHVSGGDEEQFVTRVNVLEGIFQAVNTEVKVQPGNKAVIACSSALGFPLEYCRFIRPDGRGLAITPDMNPSGRYSYEGPGLVYGYCGLAISSVEPVDIGEWRCASRSRFRLWEAETVDSIVVKMTETTMEVFNPTVLVCGILAGVFILIVTIMLAAALLQKRKNSRKDSQETIIVKSST